LQQSQEKRKISKKGITRNLNHRMSQHKASLLYTEAHKDKHEAAKRERQIKGWRREKKLSLIKKGNQVRG
jgi:predicted GIY-YIG superfamily endonuclease